MWTNIIIGARLAVYYSVCPLFMALGCAIIPLSERTRFRALERIHGLIVMWADLILGKPRMGRVSVKVHVIPDSRYMGNVSE